jgi:hypothetical protein
MNEITKKRAKKLKEVTSHSFLAERLILDEKSPNYNEWVLEQSRELNKVQVDTIIAVIMDVAFDYMSSPMDALNFIREVKQIKKLTEEQ